MVKNVGVQFSALMAAHSHVTPVTDLAPSSGKTLIHKKESYIPTPPKKLEC